MVDVHSEVLCNTYKPQTRCTLAIWLDHKNIVPNENSKKLNTCVGKTIYIRLKYTKSNSHFARIYRQLYMLITLGWLPGMGREGNGSGFRNKRGRENEKGRRER